MRYGIGVITATVTIIVGKHRLQRSLARAPEVFMSAISSTTLTVERRRWLALVVVCLAMLMNALDGTVVNVALPKIQHDLHFTQAGLAWVIDAYMIAFAGFLLLSGRLGDLVGRKKVFLTGLAGFTLASLVCGLARDQTLLIAARFAQG